MAGITEMFALGSPASSFVSGININQDDMPWWVVGVLGWIGMVRCITNGYGKQMTTHRAGLKRVLDKGPPEDLYKVYKSFQTYQEWVERGLEK